MDPKLMTSLCGEQITSVEMWEGTRREELRYLLEHYAYGHRPAECENITPTFKVEEEKEIEGVDYTRVRIKCDGFTFPIRLFTPKTDKAVPCFVYFMHNSQQSQTDIDNQPNNTFIPIATICSQGFAVAVIYFNDIYSDHLNLRTYDIGVFMRFGPFGDKRRDSDWAAISAWAWGASRVADYLETNPKIDMKHLAIAGHSRGGKAALWTGATDTRYTYVISNSSGCMGAAYLRGKKGEHIDFISTHTDWLCRTQWGYADKEDMYPVDQHMLLALVAPRLLYIESNSLDEWSDPDAERKSCVLASQAYELYGKKGIVLPENIEVDTAYHEGTIGYHMSSGEHRIREHDWEKFIAFWKKNMEV